MTRNLFLHVVAITSIGLTACSTVPETSTEAPAAENPTEEVAAPVAAADTTLLAHACNASCAGDAHMYLHGEKGHVCDPKCQYIRERR
jgi:hypothetical protein